MCNWVEEINMPIAVAYSPQVSQGKKATEVKGLGYACG